MKKLLLALLLLSSSCFAASPPVQWSLAGLASWAQPLIASGAALPATSTYSTGELFMVFDTASGTIYRLTGGAWTPTGGTGTGGTGTTVHSELTNLDFDSSGHTGFASSGAVVDAVSGLATSGAITEAVAGLATSGAVTEAVNTHAETTENPHGPDTYQNDGWNGFRTNSAGTFISVSTLADEDIPFYRLVTPSGGHGMVGISTPSSTLSIGVVDTPISSASYGWVQISGVANFEMETGKTASAGDVLLMSAADAGCVIAASVTTTAAEYGRMVAIATTDSEDVEGVVMVEGVIQISGGPAVGTSTVTTLGGYATAFVAGENLAQGDLVTLSTQTAEIVFKTSTSNPGPIGVAESAAALGSKVFVVHSGVGLVNVSGAVGTGTVLITSSTVRGQAEDPGTVPPPTTAEHFNEIGHPITGTSGAGQVRAILHFN